ncbi:MAG: choice-of-anchor D domain-containing protein, partial [Acidobacteria bacterium]|nr:choice-of-anchor D domain-containing protein [Acidobacteriota bacterium]
MRQIVKLFAGMGLAAALLAQQPPPFSIRAQQGQNTLVLSDGATLTFISEGVGQPQAGAITLTYTGSTTATINVIDSVGSNDFTVSLGTLVLPLTMNPGDSFTVGIGYSPTALGKVTGAVRFNFTEGRRTAAVTTNLVGVQPDFGFSFTLLPKGNQTSIAPDGTITFPDTTVNVVNPTLNQTNSALLIITNRGSGPGTVNNIASSGSTFTLSGVPLLPALVQPNTDLRFTVVFSPTQLAASVGTVKIDFVGRSAGFNLAGAGVGAVYAYEFVQGSSTRPINNNDTLTMPQTNLGDKSTATVRVRNTGNADGAVNKISISGADFTIPDMPFLPQTLAAGSSISFTIQFAPTQPITETARLLIDNV